jgi:predicted amidophosphoribosyltransferase
MLRALVALLAPPTCLACSSPAPVGAPLCADCRADLAGWAGSASPRCGRCALPLPCGPPCPAAGAAFDRSWAAAPYDGAARGLVLALKASGRRAAAGAMAARLAAQAPAGLLAGALVPVPADPARRRARGLDHTALLAAELARRTGLPLAPCLRRAPGARAQTGASRAQRLRAGRVAVEPRGPAPARAVLVDDVHTTGATLSACAGALRAAGAGEVVAVTFARTLR